MKRILQIAGIGAIIGGGYFLYTIFLSIHQMYGTEEFWLSLIGWSILVGFACIPIYAGGIILYKVSQRSVKLICAVYVAVVSYTGALWSLPLKVYFPPMRESVWQNSVLLFYAVCGVLLYYRLLHYIFFWENVEEKNSSTFDTKIIIGLLALLSSFLFVDVINLRQIFNIQTLAADVAFILTFILYFIGVKLCIHSP